jgi:hypothetical protein
METGARAQTGPALPRCPGVVVFPSVFLLFYGGALEMMLATRLIQILMQRCGRSAGPIVSPLKLASQGSAKVRLSTPKKRAASNQACSTESATSGAVACRGEEVGNDAECYCSRGLWDAQVGTSRLDDAEGNGAVSCVSAIRTWQTRSPNVGGVDAAFSTLPWPEHVQPPNITS